MQQTKIRQNLRARSFLDDYVAQHAIVLSERTRERARQRRREAAYADIAKAERMSRQETELLSLFTGAEIVLPSVTTRLISDCWMGLPLPDRSRCRRLASLDSQPAIQRVGSELAEKFTEHRRVGFGFDMLSWQLTR